MGWLPSSTVAVVCLCGTAVAQPGYDFVTVGAPGNRAYDGQDPFGLVAGRGAVNYEFRIGRTEVTTAQWMEFFNAAYARPDPLPMSVFNWFAPPILWGAQIDGSYTGPGTRFRLNPNIPDAGMLPVGGVSWRGAAVLCNWLHNGKSLDASAFLDGAYDVSTFSGGSPFPTFTDQVAHHPGARYWIPTLDEWMKAVHYDPNANNGQGRWWEQPNGTDTPLVYGPPPSFGGDDTAQANAGFRLIGDAEYRIPLGSYPDVQTPWGLLDAAGGTKEWNESIRVVDEVMRRGIDGSFWGSGPPSADLAYSWGQISPGTRVTYSGFRIASIVPTPAAYTIGAGVLFVLGGARRRGR